jgi:hypothetical protein
MAPCAAACVVARGLYACACVAQGLLGARATFDALAGLAGGRLDQILGVDDDFAQVFHQFVGADLHLPLRSLTPGPMRSNGPAGQEDAEKPGPAPGGLRVIWKGLTAGASFALQAACLKPASVVRSRFYFLVLPKVGKLNGDWIGLLAPSISKNDYFRQYG